MKVFFVVLFLLMSLIIYGQVKFPKEVIKYHKIKEIKQYGHDSTFYYSSQYSKKGELIGIKYLNFFKQYTTVLFSDNSFFGVKDLDSSFFKKRGK